MCVCVLELVLFSSERETVLACQRTRCHKEQSLADCCRLEVLSSNGEVTAAQVLFVTMSSNSSSSGVDRREVAAANRMFIFKINQVNIPQCEGLVAAQHPGFYGNAF